MDALLRPSSTHEKACKHHHEVLACTYSAPVPSIASGVLLLTLPEIVQPLNEIGYEYGVRLSTYSYLRALSSFKAWQSLGRLIS
jgi:hypothetical protein